MLTNEEIAAFVGSGYEIPAVEFKGPGSLKDNAFVARVARAAIALANQRDGGWIILGIDEKDDERSGLTPEQVTEWLDYDAVVDKINRYADPPLRIDRAARELQDGRPLVVLQVSEFEDIPVLAARDYPGTIQKGQLYTRSLHKPESSGGRTQNELRAVLDLATQKQLARFYRQASAANLTVQNGDTAESQYAAEGRAFLEGAEIDELESQAHYYFTIQPALYDAERVEYVQLPGVIRNAAVSMRGWPYPHVFRPTNGETWVAEVEKRLSPEAWVAYESGQFQSWHSVPLDGRSHTDMREDATTDHGYIPYESPIIQFVEVILFAQRLQAAVAPSVPYRVLLGLRGAKGWELVTGHPRRSPLRGDYRLATDDWNRTVDLPASVGAGDARELALAPTLRLLHRFGWGGVTDQIVRAVQDEALGSV